MANEKRLIDANSVKTMIKNFGKSAINDGQKSLDPVDDIILLAKGVDFIPSMDAVEVVHGRWEMGVDEGDYEYGTCSVCGYNEYNAFCCLLPHNYCPNCGAKMDGGNEDG